MFVFELDMKRKKEDRKATGVGARGGGARREGVSLALGKLLQTGDGGSACLNRALLFPRPRAVFSFLLFATSATIMRRYERSEICTTVGIDFPYDKARTV